MRYYSESEVLDAVKTATSDAGLFNTKMDERVLRILKKGMAGIKICEECQKKNEK